MVERRAIDLEVRVRIPIQVQIFLLKFMKLLVLEMEGHQECQDYKKISKSTIKSKMQAEQSILYRIKEEN